MEVLPWTLESETKSPFILHASSERTPHELWTYGDTILSIQAHPELSAYFIKKLIIDRLSKLGKLDETQRQVAESQLFNADQRLRRHLMLRIITHFLGILD